MHYINEAEHVVADCLHRHRGTKPQTDDLPQLIAVAATGAYRVTIMTHSPARRGQKLTTHLREALATLGAGLADKPVAQPKRRVSRRA
jgi:hypothetical protein